jgi:hypothetical protein
MRTFALLMIAAGLASLLGDMQTDASAAFLGLGALAAPLIGGAIGAVGGLFGGGGEQETQTPQLDPRIAELLRTRVGPRGFEIADQLSGRVPGLLDIDFDPTSFQQYMDPFQQEVIGATQADFARQREMAEMSAQQQSVQAGPSGGRGSREAVLQANLVGDVNRNEIEALARLRSGGFQQANQRALQAAGFNLGRLGMEQDALNFGLTGGLPGGAFTGQQIDTQPSGGVWSRILGGAVGGATAGAGFGGGGGGGAGADLTRGIQFNPPTGLFDNARVPFAGRR